MFNKVVLASIVSFLTIGSQALPAFAGPDRVRETFNTERAVLDNPSILYTRNGATAGIPSALRTQECSAGAGLLYANLSEGRMYYQRSCVLMFTAMIIPGKSSTPTPKGTFSTESFESPCTLRPSTGGAFNSYKCIFIKDHAIAFHGASAWRSADQFINKLAPGIGSHGCLNMTNNAVGKLYGMLGNERGIKVVIR